MDIKNKKIVIVDDEESLCSVLEKFFKIKNIEVYVFNRVTECLNQIDDIKPDIVITDIVMPNIDGLEFIMKLRKKFDSIKIIAMSGNIVGKKYLDTAFEFGADVTIKKTFDLEEIYQTIINL